LIPTARTSELLPERAPAFGHKLVSSDSDKVVVVSSGARTEMTGNNRLAIKAGSAIIRSQRGFSIDVLGTEVRVSRGATVLLSGNEGSIRVACLHDHHSDSVKVSHSNTGVTLTSGREVFLCDAPPSLKDIYDIQSIARRSIHAHELGTHGWITGSEVS